MVRKKRSGVRAVKKPKAFDINAIVRDVCKIEGGKVNLSVAQVREVIACYLAVESRNRSAKRRANLSWPSFDYWYEYQEYVSRCVSRKRKDMLAAGIIEE